MANEGSKRIWAWILITVLLLAGLVGILPKAMSAEGNFGSASVEQLKTSQAREDTGLVACWHFDEGSGSIAYDSSGNGNHGTIYGATWTSGVNGSALSFDGVNDYVMIPSSSSLDIKENITLEAWVKFGDIYEQSQQILWRGDAQAGHDPYFLCINESGIICFARDVRENSRVEVNTSITGLDDGVFHHIVGVYNHSSGNMSLYIDGNLVAEKYAPGVASYSTTGMWNVIGAVDYGNYQNFKGSIDEVCIYKRALSAEEIQAHYKEYANKVGPVACWHFDEGSGSIAYDSSGNGNHGTIYGATWTSGVNGSALSFDGVNDYIMIPSSSSLDIKENITLEAWVKFGDIYEQSQQILWRGDAQAGHDPYFLCINESGIICFARDVRENSRVEVNTSITGLDDGVFHHIVGVYNHSSGNMSLYIDGNLVAEKYAPGVASYSTTGMWNVIGAVDYGNYQNFKGSIDEVCIYKRALSAEEIQAHYKEYSYEVNMTLEKTEIEGKKDNTVKATITVKRNGAGVPNIPATVTFDKSGLSANTATTAPDGTAIVIITLTQDFSQDTIVKVTPKVAGREYPDKAVNLTVKAKAAYEVTMSLEKTEIEGKKDNTVKATITVKANGVGVPNLTATATFNNTGLSANTTTTAQNGTAIVTITLAQDFMQDTIVKVIPKVAGVEYQDKAVNLTVRAKAAYEVTMSLEKTEIEGKKENTVKATITVKANGIGVPNLTATVTFNNTSLIANFAPTAQNGSAVVTITIAQDFTSDALVKVTPKVEGIEYPDKAMNLRVKAKVTYEVSLVLEKAEVEGKKGNSINATITVRAGGMGVANISVTLVFDKPGLSASTETTANDGTAVVTITVAQDFASDAVVKVTPRVAGTEYPNAAQSLTVKAKAPPSQTPGFEFLAVIGAIAIATFFACQRSKKR